MLQIRRVPFESYRREAHTLDHQFSNFRENLARVLHFKSNLSLSTIEQWEFFSQSHLELALKNSTGTKFFICSKKIRVDEKETPIKPNNIP